MKYLRRLAGPIPVEEVVQELEQNPDLWNEFTLRTEAYSSPHTAVSDIWVRYRSWDDWIALKGLCADRAEAVKRFTQDEHDSVWYPAGNLWHLRRVIFEVMHFVEAERLGGVLITRIPLGGRVDWHVDHGWHARYYEKVAVQLKSAPGQAFCFEDGEFECEPGTVYTFNNSASHSVVNRSSEERITAIICVKRDARLKPLWCSDDGQVDLLEEGR